MRALAISLSFWLSLLHPATASPDQPGDFDYYVMALSWNAAWCEREGDARGADQCDPRHDFGFTLHGLWPQHEAGWPSYCRTSARDPSRRQTAAMADIMGSQGLAWHQWKKHGRCSGLGAVDYFALSRAAYDRIERPAILRNLPRDMELPPHVIEDAFIESNPALSPNGVTVTCRDGLVQEVRICLSHDLSPRMCGRDVIKDCNASRITIPKMR